MTPEIYRYTFAPSVPATEVEATLTLVLLAVEGLHGRSRLRREGSHTFDADQDVVVIEVRGAQAGT